MIQCSATQPRPHKSRDTASTDHQEASRPSQDQKDTEALLAEIDGLLETNAEDFVRGFVQKSGE